MKFLHSGAHATAWVRRQPAGFERAVAPTRERPALRLPRDSCATRGTEGAGQHGPTRRHARVIWGLFGNLLRVTICAACSVVLDFFYFIEYLSAS